MAAQSELTGLAAARLEHRGFEVVKVDAQDLEASDGEAATAPAKKLEELARARSIPASFALQWNKAPVEDMDSAHADEAHYSVAVSFTARKGALGENTAGVTREFRTESRKDELLEEDGLPQAGVRLMTDVFIEAGSKALASRGNAGHDAQAGNEVWVVFSGIKSFGDFAKIKSKHICLSCSFTE